MDLKYMKKKKSKTSSSTTPATITKPPAQAEKTTWEKILDATPPTMEMFEDWCREGTESTYTYVAGPGKPDAPLSIEEFNIFLGYEQVAQTALTTSLTISPSAKALFEAAMSQYNADEDVSFDDLALAARLLKIAATHKLERIVTVDQTVAHQVSLMMVGRQATTVFDPTPAFKSEHPVLPSINEKVIISTGPGYSLFNRETLDDLPYITYPWTDESTEDDHAVLKEEHSEALTENSNEMGKIMYNSLAYVASSLKALPGFVENMSSPSAQWFKALFASLVKIAETSPFKIGQPNVSFVMPADFIACYDKFRNEVRSALKKQTYDIVPPMKMTELEKHRSYRQALPDSFKDFRDVTGHIKDETVSVNSKWTKALEDTIKKLRSKEENKDKKIRLFAVGHSNENRWQHTLTTFDKNCLGCEEDILSSEFEITVNEFLRQCTSNVFTNTDETGNTTETTEVLANPPLMIFVSDVFIENAKGIKDKYAKQAAVHQRYSDLNLVNKFDALIVKAHPTTLPPDTKLEYTPLLYYSRNNACGNVVGPGYTRMHNMELLFGLFRSSYADAEMGEEEEEESEEENDQANEEKDPENVDNVGDDDTEEEEYMIPTVTISLEFIQALSLWAAKRGQFFNYVRNALLCTGMPFIDPAVFFLGFDKPFRLPRLPISSEWIARVYGKFSAAVEAEITTMAAMSNVDSDSILQLLGEKVDSIKNKESKAPSAFDPKLARQAKDVKKMGIKPEVMKKEFKPKVVQKSKKKKT